MLSETLLKHQARKIATARGWQHTSALHFVARRAGLQSWQAAQAQIPDIERKPHRSAIDSVSITVAIGGVTIRAFDAQHHLLLNETHPAVTPFRLALARSIWLLGGSPVLAKYLEHHPAEASRVNDAESGNAAMTLTVADMRHYTWQLIGRNSFAINPAPPPLVSIKKAMAMVSEPLRADLNLRRNQAGDATTSVPHTITYHAPSGFDWGYRGSGPADLALNLINAWVPPFTDGFDCVALPQGQFCSQTASHRHQWLKEQLIESIPAEGGTIPRAAVAALMEQAVRDTAEHTRQAYGYSAIRCADEISYLGWLTPQTWLTLPEDA